jgi:hypothetical protein
VKHIRIVKSAKVEVKPFDIDDFTVDKEPSLAMKKISKKELRILAKELGLDYDEASLNFAKKLLNAQIKRSI